MNDDILKMAKEAWGEDHEIFWFDDNGIERFYNLVRADEREACARVCETGVDYPHPTVKGVVLKNFGGSTLLATAIRARSKA